MSDNMNIVNCPNCDGKLRVPTLSETKQVKCGHCQQSFQLAPEDVVIDAVPGLSEMGESHSEVVRCPECRGKIRIPRIQTKTLVACGHCNQSILLEPPPTVADAVILEPRVTQPGQAQPTPSPAVRSGSGVLPGTMFILVAATIAILMSTSPKLKEVSNWDSWLDITFSWDLAGAVVGFGVMAFVFFGILTWLLGKIFSAHKEGIGALWGAIFLGTPLGVLLSPAVAWAAHDSQWHSALSTTITKQLLALKDEEAPAEKKEAIANVQKPVLVSRANAASPQDSVEAIAATLQRTMIQCETNSLRMERFKGTYLGYERTTPGSFNSFGLLKSLYASQSPVNKETLEALLLKDLAQRESANCRDWDARLKKLNMAANTCDDMNRLTACLLEIDSVHKSHIGKRNIYERRYIEALGVYNRAYLHESFKNDATTQQTPVGGGPNGSQRTESAVTASPTPADAKAAQWQAQIAAIRLNDGSECGRMPPTPRLGASNYEISSANNRAEEWERCIRSASTGNDDRLNALMRQLNTDGCCDAQSRSDWGQLNKRAHEIESKLVSHLQKLDAQMEDFNREQEAYAARERSYSNDSYSTAPAAPNYQVPPETPGFVKGGMW